MCNQCEEHEEPLRLFSRRSFLAIAAATAGGVAVGYLGCREEPKKSAEQRAVAPANASAPDLGSEVFPDAAGRAIAKPSDAPVLVIPRSKWTSTHPNLAEVHVMNGVHRITVHHTAMPLSTDAWQPTANELETIREFHTGTAPADRNWADIAYHFVIDRAGRVWQARPLAYQGARMKNQNEHNLGIVLLGNFDVQSPAAAQLVSLTAFVGFTRRLYTISLKDIFTHRELGETGCPGQRLQDFMNRARKKWSTQNGG